jgi:hypothetical protein
MRHPLMRSVVLSAAVAAVSIFAQPSFAQPATPPAVTRPASKPAQVPVKVVVLFSSGVGYFEHAGTVNGSGSTELRFKSKQINDVLKSLILEDSGGGKVTAVSYPSQDPVDRTLKSFQVDITGNPSLGDLLGQLRGAKVNVNVGPEALEGTILGLEKRAEPTGKDQPPVERWVMNLIADGTIRQVELEKVTKLELEDPTLKQELARALQALAQSRDQDKKPVTITFNGDGERLLRIGYVVETPIWKTSYRLVLDEDKDKKTKGSIQGWAIVENQTDNDWDNVQLSLVSGRPISFIEDLYQPLYVPRPVVKPELYASLTPQTYDAGLEAGKPVREFRDTLAEMPAPAAPPAGASGMATGGAVMRSRGLAASAAKSESEMLRRPMDATSSVASVASAAKLGELFQYTVGSVSLPRQRSAMIPIITDPVQVEPLSIYNQSVLAGHPLTGARVKNTTGKHLLAGPVTVLQGGRYAGDASLDNVPPGQERLLSFGVDLDVKVDATKNHQENTIVSGNIAKGVLRLYRKQVLVQEYQAENKGDKDKALLIEHPVHQGWKLVDTDKPVETTETLYRFQGKVAANKATKLTVKEEQVQQQDYALLPTDVGTIQFYATNGEIPQKVRDALAKAAALKSAMVDTQRQIDERNAQVQQISTEQQRMRENMKAVAQNTEYYNRLVGKLNDQESKIEGLQKEQHDLRDKLDQQRKDLEEYVQNLNVD